MHKTLSEKSPSSSTSSVGMGRKARKARKSAEKRQGKKQAEEEALILEEAKKISADINEPIAPLTKVIQRPDYAAVCTRRGGSYDSMLCVASFSYFSSIF